jgi:hypothetical protein
MDNGKYSIGQTVFLIPKNANKILPAIIKEEIITRRVDGEKIDFIVSVGPPGQVKNINIEKLDCDVCGSIEEVKEMLGVALQEMVIQFNKNIEQLCQTALTNATKWYGTVQTNISQNSSNEKIDPSILVSDSEQMMPLHQPFSNNPQDQQQALRQTLTQRISVPEDNIEGLKVQLPDGRIVPVRQ